MWGSEWPPELYYRMMQKQRAGGSGAGGFSPISQAPHSWFDPSDLTSLFQDSAMTTPVTANNDPVGAMRDKSGNGHHLTQPTVGERPTYKTSGGLHWLEFAAGTGILANFSAPSPSLDRISALRFTGDGGANYIYRPFSGFSGGLYENGNVSLVVYDGGADLTYPLNPTRDVDFVVTEHHEPFMSKLTVENASYVSGDAGSTFSDGLVIGGGRAFRFFGLVERAAFSDPEIALLRTYLAAKQGRVL